MGRRFEQAHHEAAHCVAAIAQGLCVRWVTLAPVDNHAAGTHVERAIFSAADNPDAQIEALKIDITVAFAGACAQMKLRPTLKRNHPVRRCLRSIVRGRMVFELPSLASSSQALPRGTCAQWAGGRNATFHAGAPGARRPRQLERRVSHARAYSRNA